MPPVVAAVAAGIAAGVAASSVIVGVAVAIGTVALQNSLKPETPKYEQDVEDAQTMTTSSIAPRRGVYGETVISGPIIGYGKLLQGFNDQQKEWHVVGIFLADHPCESVQLYKVNDKDPSEVGATAVYYLGNQTQANQTMMQVVDGWTANHIGHGITYAVVKIPIDDEKIPQGLRNIKFKVKGKKVYDPRKDSTIGGSGTHRHDDPATWQWSSNPIICGLDYMRFHGYREQPINRFDLADIAAEANICDEVVSYTDGGTTKSGPRFSVNGTWTYDEGPAEVLNHILATCAGKPYRRAGKIYLKTGSYHGPAIHTITSKDLAGRVRYRPNTPEREKCNTVRATYIDPEAGYISAESKVVTNSIYVNEDGAAREHELRLRYVTSSIQAQRLQKLHLERNRAGFMVELTVGPSGLLALPGKTIELDIPEDGISGEFIVADWNYNQTNKTVDLVLQIEYPEIYGDDIHDAVKRPVFDIPDNTQATPPTALQFTPTPSDNSRQGVLTWEHPSPSSVLHYIVRIYSDPDVQMQDDEILIIEQRVEGDNLREFAVNGLNTGDYVMEVAAVNKHNRESLPVRIYRAIEPPAKPDAINFTVGNFHIEIEPSAPGLNHYATFEVKASSDATEANAVIIGTGAKVVENGLQPEQTRYYWARSVGPFGQSDWFGPLSATTTRDATQIVDVLTGAITQQQFAEDLASRIDLIDVAALSPEDGGIIGLIIDENGQSRIVSLEQANSALAQRIQQVYYSGGQSYKTNSVRDLSSSYVGEETPQIGESSAVDTATGILLKGGQWAYTRRPIPIDTSRTYKVRARFRVTKDSTDTTKRKFYVGVVTLDENLNFISGGPGTHRYCTLVGQSKTVADGIVDVSGEITGEGNTSHSEFRPGTKYARLVFISHYSGGDGEAELQALSIEDVTEYAATEDRAKAYTDEETGKLKAERVIKVDANGVVGGIGLLADEATQEAVLYFFADQIAYLPAGYTGTNPAADAQAAPYYFENGVLYLAASKIDRLTVNQIEGIDSLDLSSGIIEERHLAESLRQLLFFRNLEEEIIEGGGSSIKSTDSTSTATQLTSDPITSAGQDITLAASFRVTQRTVRGMASAPSVTFRIRDMSNSALIDLGSGATTKTVYGSVWYEPELDESWVSLNTTVNVKTTKPVGNSYQFRLEITAINNTTYNPLKTTFSVSEPVTSYNAGEGEPIDWSRIVNKPVNIVTATKNGGSYWGLMNPDGNDTGWIRTPTSGLLPHASGGASQIGTAAWPYLRGYFNEIYRAGTEIDALYLRKTATEFSSVVSANDKVSSKTGDLQLQRAGVTKLTLTTTGASVEGTLMGTVDLGIGSDRRLKNNIEPIVNALDIIGKLHGYRYERIDNDNQPQIGVIAQEVEEVLPEAVGRHPKGFMTVFYQQLTAVLIEAVNELREEVKQLKATIQEMNNGR